MFSLSQVTRPLCLYFYRPQRSWGKVMFLHVSVILFTGGSASVLAGIPHPPRDQAPPPGADTLWSRPPWRPPRSRSPRTRHPWSRPPRTRHPSPSRHPLPPEQCMLGDTVNKRAVCILLECNLVSDVFSLE